MSLRSGLPQLSAVTARRRTVLTRAFIGRRTLEPYREPKNQEPKNLRTREPENLREPENPRTREPEHRLVRIEKCQREARLVVDPLFGNDEASTFSHPFDLRLVVLVRALGPDALAAREPDRDAGPANRDRLIREALEMHLDPLRSGIPNRTVRKAADLERAFQFAIDADEQVAIERRRDAKRIVVRQEQIAFGLDEIRAEQQEVARRERAADLAQELVGCRRIEVTDVRAEQQHQHRVTIVALFRRVAQSDLVGLAVTDDGEMTQAAKRALRLLERL